MSYEMLVGLNVVDDNMYTQYRESMMPILKEHGGHFGYDFKIGEVLKSETDNPINRVFTLCFPSKEKQQAFFSNANYLVVKEKFFVNSVAHRTLIADYERSE
ncbi:DUF1330 domain-containing protein [Aliikangiella coralliicola]|uniref:DUF1330 domain-containing protein n=1 Tax=Aliikangiella coralliicola TaxID=2592383 RepID=A0A545U677_9GAMM|nr:DUF1330 domain-containing protein [Aliikangiella coralliicola]TQV84913.1 DUF1330 domain-containing protein [Aliikangiella coralliicola]